MHRTPEQKQGSDDRSDQYLKIVVNRPVSGKLRQSTNISSQFEIFPSPKYSVLGTLIGDLTSKRALLFFTLLCSREIL